MSQNMPQKLQQWMVKSLEGKLSGPHTLQQVVDLIYKGKLTGAEKISEYPGGLWKTLSQYPQFYDPLFAVLANKNLPQEIEIPSPLLESNPVTHQEEVNRV